MTEKMSVSAIIEQALVWAEESIDQMIAGHSDKDPHRAELIELRRQMRAYHRRRFGKAADGKAADPFAGAKALSLDELRKLRNG